MLLHDLDFPASRIMSQTNYYYSSLALPVLFRDTINSELRHWLDTGHKKHFSVLPFHGALAFRLRPWGPWPEKAAELATDDGGSFVSSGHVGQKSILSAPLSMFGTNLQAKENDFWHAGLKGNVGSIKSMFCEFLPMKKEQPDYK